MAKIDLLYQSGKTVFSIYDLRLLWGETNPNDLKSKTKYYVDKGRLQRIKKGIYSLTKDYEPFELAQKLLQPSYVSLGSALRHYGLIFQTSTEITAMALYWRQYKIGSTIYTFHALSKKIFFHPLGILKEKNYWIASKERAITDTFYLHGETSFDYLPTLDKELLRKLADIYDQKSTKKLIQKFIDSL